MTIRLLCAYDKYPANAIVTLDAGTETGLITANLATATLTGGVVYFAPVPVIRQAKLLFGGGYVTVKANEQANAQLPEGQALTVTGAANTTGAVQRVDASGAVLQSWVIGSGALPPIGPFAGSQQFQVYCSTGNISATVGDAVVGTALAANAPAKGLKTVFWGDSAMGNSAFQTSVSAIGVCTQTNGLATAHIVAHGCYKGEPINIVNSEDTYWYGKHTVSTVIDADNIQFAVDSRAIPDLYNSKTADGIAVPAIILSHQHGKNNPALQSMMLAGVIPTDFVNLGANTQTALSMAWHIERDLADYPDYDLWVCATVGANDVRANGGSGNLKKALDNAKARLLRLKQAGKRVLYLGWQPNDARDSGKSPPCYQADGVTAFPSNTDTVAKCTARFHQEMGAWCVENGIEYLPQYMALVDPASASGYAVTGTTANDLLADGVHFGKRAAYKFAKQLGAPWFKSIFPGRALPLPASLMDRQHDTAGAVVNQASNYIIRNPLLLTVSGTAGLAADCAIGVAFGMPAVVSFALNPRTLATDGDALGNNQRAVFSTTVTSKDQAGSLTFTVPTADIKLGGKIRACAHVQFSGLASFEGYRMYLSIVTSNYGTIAVSATVSEGTSTDVNNFDDTEVISEYPFTPWAFIPADAAITSAALVVQGYVKAASGAGTAGFIIDVGRPGVESRVV
ncbi:hypothetical protein [Rugamonas aquatica]|uniref:Uncharacterized protein n=1 Tax=Rugamonas aquatica TaxID=2743357 RepID=A0A6A7N1T6_9BURK|nr:hypothetical protein [Rugamonas aquatica]MQA39029.1 hypothetical protein [Rugamonas aquatica]